MKILAIAGKNLASLGAFELNLDQSPFDREGLFAITGPTGAGKSTILDAMCVALYDRIPRLQSAKKSIKLGSDEGNPYTNLSLTDPRQLMRRGAKDCFAATTFLSANGKRYRAKWEIQPRVRKAKTLNDAHLSLENLETGDVFSGKKTEVLEAIREKVGLSFDQFCRSVLLAQGDFAAFLKADGGKRAELLERMTGTEIYKNLSVAAFERGKTEQQKLDDLQVHIQARNLLPQDTRLTLSNDQENKQQNIKVVRDALKRQQRLVTGLEKSAALQQSLTLAKESFAQAETSWHALADQQLALMRWDQLAEARQLARALDKDSLLQKQVLDSIKESSTQKEALTTQTQQLDRDFEARKQQKTALTQEIATIKPELERARALDLQINERQNQLQTLSQTIDHQKSKQEIHQKALTNLLTEHASWKDSQAQAAQRIEDLDRFKSLSQAWPQYEQLFEQVIENRNNMMRTTEQLMQAEWLGTELQREEEIAQAQLQHSQLGCDHLAQANQHLEKQAPRISRDQWSEKQKAHQQRHEAFRELGQLHREAQTLQNQNLEIEQESKNLSTRLEQQQTVVNQTQTQLPKLVGQLSEAKRHFEQLLIASSENAESLRQHLQPGEACPVCGSEEHPYSQNSPLNPLLEQSRARIASLETETKTLETKQTTAIADIAVIEERRQHLVLQMNENHVRLAVIQEETGQWCREIPSMAPMRAGSPEAMLELQNIERQVQETSCELGHLETELNAHEHQRSLFSQARLIAQQLAHARTKIVNQVHQKWQTTQHQFTASQTMLERLGGEIDQHLTQLRVAVPNMATCLKQLASKKHHYVRQLHFKVDELLQNQDRHAKASELVNGLEPKLASETKAHELISEQLKQQQTTYEQGKQDCQALLVQRQEILGGRDIAAVEAQQHQTMQQLDQSLETLGNQREVARNKLIQKTSELEHCQQQLHTLETELSQARLRIKTSFHDQGLNVEDHGYLLEKDQQWATQIRDQLKLAKAELDVRKGAQQAAQNQLAQHLAEFECEEDLATAVGQSEVLQHQVEVLEQQLASLQQQLEADDALRLQVQDLQHAYDQQAEITHLWSSMRDLIGSADGKKFRLFAQSLTLEMLLHHANHHLDDLARRYHLERLPGTDLSLRVIDRDMGDEVRSISSLSGGETFLVSLALALGLASFSSSQTPIESLFIDEGFGSLDADSLESAINALEALQAQGRQVGIISHVQTLMERIAAQVRVRKCGGGRSEVELRFLGSPVLD